MLCVFTNGTIRQLDNRVFNKAPNILENTGDVNGFINALPSELVYNFSNNCT